MGCSTVAGRRAVSLSLQGIIDPALAEYGARVLYAARVYAGLLDGFEIGFFTDQVARHRPALERADVRAALAAFPANTLHVAARRGGPPAPADLKACAALAGELFQAGLLRHLSLHLDMDAHFDAVAAAAPEGLPLLFENTDRDAARGNGPGQCRAALAAHPRWGLVLDYAHALETEERGAEGPEALARLAGAALGQVHFSWSGDLYPRELVGPEFTTRHSMVHLASGAGAARARAFLRAAAPPLTTIEGVVPPGEAGRAMVLAEAALVRAALAGEEAR